LLVRQILGEYRVKSPNLQSLHQRASELIRRFTRFFIHHIPREKNRKADALANKAQDLRASGEETYQT
jgi:ribonuclease HI